MAKKLKAYKIIYKTFDESDEEKRVLVVANDMNEATQKFIVWADHKCSPYFIESTEVLRKCKKNAYYYTNEFYEKQEAYLKQLIERN